MKLGRSLTDLAKEIERQRDSKVDLLAPTKRLRMVINNGEPQMAIGDDRVHGIRKLGHEQLGTALSIPRQYYDRMAAERPTLLATNVNDWMHSSDDKKLVRILDNNMRAFLSDRFRTLDNFDFMEAALPSLLGSGAEIVSCEVTERRLYIKAVDKKAQREVQLKTGHKIGDGSHAFYKDIVCPAIVLSNSEVGAGSLSVQASVYTEGCTNMCVQKESSVRKYHVGARQEMGDEAYRMLSDKTRKLTDAATWAQIGDIVSGAFNATKFDAYVTKLTAATEVKMEGDPAKIIEVTGKRYGMTEAERTSVMRHLIEGGDLSKYGLHSAVTRAAQDLEDYDRATDFEKVGGEIIELGAGEWKEILKHAA